MDTILVTGGAGFIGSNFVLLELERRDFRIINFDSLTYAGNLMNLQTARRDPRHIFIRGDICDRELVKKTLEEFRPAAVVHFAAESHVDRSISDPECFVKTNVLGTYYLLEQVLDYWRDLPAQMKSGFRFLQVSTDEVFGSLGALDAPFTETTPYAPRSPYSASKASADHLVRSYHHTYGLPVIVTNCSNNYGPMQFPEKLIPLLILNAVQGKPLPIYGTGQNVRDWLYVGDHCEALAIVLRRGEPGDTYNLGGNCEKTNIEVAEAVCRILDKIHPESSPTPHKALITFVKDRPGHDWRYSMDISRIRERLGWEPRESFETGLEKTVRWYLSNREWVESVRTGKHREWTENCCEVVRS